MKSAMRIYPLASISVLLLALSACGRTSPSVDRDIQAIHDLRERIQAAENAGRAEDMATTVADDVIVFPPNAPPINGAPAFVDYLRTAFQSVTLAVRYQSAETVVSGDWGFDRGTYTGTVTPKAGGPGVNERGNYVWLARRGADGAWQYARIIWNSDVPAPTGK